MVYLSSGHAALSKKSYDPGAIGNGQKEGLLTIEFKKLVQDALASLQVSYVSDTEEESLSEYLRRIKPGNASVVLEIHFDAAGPTATGTTAIVGADADRLDKAFAKELAETTAAVLGIKNRGVISEADSHRGRLGLMREQGIVCLMELCFISNKNDLKTYQLRKRELAAAQALIIAKYERMIA